MAKRGSSVGCGTIRNAGGNAHEYLGHFGKPDVLKRGHNFGPPPNVANPSGNAPAGVTPIRPTFNATTNPIAAARQANRADIAAAKTAGGGLGAVRAENRARLAGAVTQRKERNAEGFKASDRAALKAARGVARAETQASRSAARTTARNERQTARSQKQAAVGSAKAGLKSAVGDVRSARQELRQAIRGGNVAGAGQAFQALQGAKTARGTARAGVRSARKTGLGALV
jgi:hypothetical protein